MAAAVVNGNLQTSKKAIFIPFLLKQKTNGEQEVSGLTLTGLKHTKFARAMN